MENWQRTYAYNKVVRRHTYGSNFPVLDNAPVTEGHVRYCSDYGHEKHWQRVAGSQHRLSPVCIRCGEHVWNPNTHELTRVSLVKQ